jgi:uncharacterized membrane protein YgaE (UPF0421/DUF939 family)
MCQSALEFRVPCGISTVEFVRDGSYSSFQRGIQGIVDNNVGVVVATVAGAASGVHGAVFHGA